MIVREGGYLDTLKTTLNEKNITIYDGGTLRVELGSRIDVRGGSTYDIRARGQSFIEGDLDIISGSTAILIVNGLLYIYSNGSVILDSSDPMRLSELKGSGTIMVAGVLYLEPGFTDFSDWDADPIGRLIPLGGTITGPEIKFRPGDVIEGDWDVNGVVRIDDDVTIGKGATLNINDGGEVIFSGGVSGDPLILTVEDGATLNVADGGSLVLDDYTEITIDDGGKLVIDDGGSVIIGENSELKIEGDLEVSGGELVIGQDGTLTIEKGGELVIDDGGELVIGLDGEVTIKEGAVLAIGNGGELVIEEDGELTIASGGQAIIGGGAEVIVDGDLTVEGDLLIGGDMTIGDDGTLEVSVKLTIRGGTLDLTDSDGTFNLDDGGELIIGHGGTLLIDGENNTLTMHANAEPIEVQTGGRVVFVVEDWAVDEKLPSIETMILKAGAELVIESTDDDAPASASFTLIGNSAGSFFRLSTGEVEIDFTGDPKFTFDGTVTIDGIGMSASWPPYNHPNFISISEDQTFIFKTGSITIPASRGLVIMEDGKLEISSGVTMYVNGNLIIASGGELDNSGTIRGSGTLAIEGGSTTTGNAPNETDGLEVTGTW